MNFKSILSIIFCIITALNINNAQSRLITRDNVGSGSNNIAEMITNVSLNGNNLDFTGQLGAFNGTVNLSTYVNTDNQSLSISGNTLSISGGNSVVLPLGSSDNLGNHIMTQTLNTNNEWINSTGAANTGLLVNPNNTLLLDATPSGTGQMMTLSSGNVRSVVEYNVNGFPQGQIRAGAEGSAFAITADGSLGMLRVQSSGQIQFNRYGTNFDDNTPSHYLSIDNSGNISKTPVPASSGNIAEMVTNVALAGTNLNFTGQLGAFNGSVDLSSLQDGTGTDNQTLSLSGNTLSISNGNSITLPIGGVIPHYIDISTALADTGLSSGDEFTIDYSDGTGTARMKLIKP